MDGLMYAVLLQGESQGNMSSVGKRPGNLGEEEEVAALLFNMASSKTTAGGQQAQQTSKQNAEQVAGRRRRAPSKTRLYEDFESDFDDWDEEDEYIAKQANKRNAKTRTGEVLVENVQKRTGNVQQRVNEAHGRGTGAVTGTMPGQAFGGMGRSSIPGRRRSVNHTDIARYILWYQSSRNNYFQERFNRGFYSNGGIQPGANSSRSDAGSHWGAPMGESYAAPMIDHAQMGRFSMFDAPPHISRAGEQNYGHNDLPVRPEDFNRLVKELMASRGASDRGLPNESQFSGRGWAKSEHLNSRSEGIRDAAVPQRPENKSQANRMDAGLGQGMQSMGPGENLTKVLQDFLSKTGAKPRDFERLPPQPLSQEVLLGSPRDGSHIRPRELPRIQTGNGATQQSGGNFVGSSRTGDQGAEQQGPPNEQSLERIHSLLQKFAGNLPNNLK